MVLSVKLGWQLIEAIFQRFVKDTSLTYSMRELLYQVVSRRIMFALHINKKNMVFREFVRTDVLFPSNEAVKIQKLNIGNQSLMWLLYIINPLFESLVQKRTLKKHNPSKNPEWFDLKMRCAGAPPSGKIPKYEQNHRNISPAVSQNTKSKLKCRVNAIVFKLKSPFFPFKTLVKFSCSSISTFWVGFSGLCWARVCHYTDETCSRKTVARNSSPFQQISQL